MFVRITLSFLFFLLFFSEAQSQVNSAQKLEFNELPVQFLQVVKNYPLINPAYAAVDSGVNIVSGNKMNFGAYRIFRTNYLSATVRMRGASRDSVSPNNHGIGLAALTDKEGEFINRNRLYLTYAYKISLTQNFHLSTGISLGMANYAIQGSNISPSGSAIAPDGNVGIWMFTRKSYLGVSLNQFFNSRLTPIGETSVLVRHLNVIAGKTVVFSPFVQLKSSVVVRSAKNFATDVDVVNLFVVHDKLSAGFNYKHHKAFVFMVGLESIPFRQGKHQAGGWFSYSIPFGKYVVKSIQPYEITLTYKIL
jgi:type IX secretion system PorP/SprF family membrane protein